MLLNKLLKTASSIAGVAALMFSGVAQAQFATVENTSGEAGEQVTVNVNWTGEDSGASGTNINLAFDASNPIPADGNGNPNCTVNPDIMKESTSFRYRPTGCDLGVDCDQVLAGVISFNPNTNANPIPDGLVFSCPFNIPGDAVEGDEFAIDIALATAVFPDGSEETVTDNSSGGVVSVVVPPTPTNTPEATNTPVPTNTSPPTNTPVPTSTRSGGGGGDDDDGCQVVAPASSGAGWLLLIPAAALLWQRRRSR